MRVFQQRFLGVLLILLLSFASFWRILQFDFFQDDSFILWTSFYNFPASVNYFLHPGTLLQMYVLSHIFELHQVFWFLFAIILKVIVACLTGIFLYTITQSRVAGFLASVFFSVCYIGMDALHTPLNNVPLLTAIPLLLALIYLVHGLKTNKNSIKKFSIYLFVALLLDPARVLPIIFLLPFFLILFSKATYYHYVKKIFARMMFFVVIIGIPLFALWYIRFAQGSQIEIFLSGIYRHPIHTAENAKYTGNFFATIANAFIEPIYGMVASQPFLDTAYYTRFFGIAGVGLFFVGLGSFWLSLRNKSRFLTMVSLWILWTFLFYIPNWFKEPRTPMAAEHHYLFLSSIGFVCLCAYLCSFIKSKRIILLVSVCFIGLNVYKANYLLAEQLPFRSAYLNGNAWKTINKTVPLNEGNDIFYFSGNVWWVVRSILPWGNIHFLLLRGNNNYAQMPLLTIDENEVLADLCSSPQKTSISHVFAWKVIAPGILKNKTNQEREKLKSMNCPQSYR